MYNDSMCGDTNNMTDEDATEDEYGDYGIGGSTFAPGSPSYQPHQTDEEYDPFKAEYSPSRPSMDTSPTSPLPQWSPTSPEYNPCDTAYSPTACSPTSPICNYLDSPIYDIGDSQPPPPPPPVDHRIPAYFKNNESDSIFRMPTKPKPKQKGKRRGRGPTRQHIPCSMQMNFVEDDQKGAVPHHDLCTRSLVYDWFVIRRR